MTRTLFGGWLLVALAGCGGGARYVPVSGVVKYNGEPLKGAMVLFQPVAKQGVDAGGMGSTGRTDATGRFQLEASTATPTTGALVGRHTVRISLPPGGGGPVDTESDAVNTGKGIPKLERQVIPAKYNEQTELSFEVTTSTDQANFDLSGPPLKK